MAKFRQNHQRNNPFGGLFIRVLAFAILLALGFVFIYKLMSDSPLVNSLPETLKNEMRSDPNLRSYLPVMSNQKIVHHTYYSLSYNEKHEQADWVAYVLTKESLDVPNVSRHDRYLPDYSVESRSAYHRDYSGSGYTRGHLVPAGDMAFDSLAMKESFYMSNMSPQLRAFNNGIWKELEEQTRDWAYHDDELYVIVGPVLNKIEKTIGKENRVSVPNYFFKVLLDLSVPDQKGIGFIIPNQLCSQALQDFAVTIDSVESLTGIDFFDNLLENNLEEELESDVNIKKWKFSEKRYRLRKDKWNYQ